MNDWQTDPRVITLSIILPIFLLLTMCGGAIWYWRKSFSVSAPPAGQQPPGQPGVPPATTPTRKKFPWWKALKWAVGIILFLILLPEIKYGVNYVGNLMGAGVDGAVRGTPRSAWGIGSQPAEPVVLQGKSVGGPLWWSNNAKVQIRPSIVTEKPDNGTYFVGCMPPGSSLGLEVALMDVPRSREFYCINKAVRTSASLDGLRQNFSKKDSEDQNSAFLLNELLTKSREKGILQSHTSTSVFKEFYVQGASDQTSSLMIKRQEEKGTFQYILEVTSSEVSVTLPESFSCFWIAPVHHRDYQSRLRQKPIPAIGMSVDEAASLTEVPASDLTKLLEADSTYEVGSGYQAILVHQGNEREALKESLLRQGSAIGSVPITLRLNVPSSNKSLVDMAKPARVIVGIKL